MNTDHALRLAALSCAIGASVALAAFAPAALAQQAAPATPATAAPQAQPAAAAPAAPAAGPANAQPAAPASASPQDAEELAAGEDEEFIYEPLQVGDATQGLLAWQRSGDIASPTPRPIAGNVANRSYERYLKSFEFPIPERMTSSVRSSSGAGSGAGAATAR